MKNEKFKYNKKPIELVIFLSFISLIATGLFLYFNKLEVYRTYVKEDSFIEYLTAFLLFGLAAICLTRARMTGERKQALFYFAASLLFFFGGGEEISWGQRIFDFSTPENLKSVNTQGEFTLHNIRLFGIKLNKLIFGTILYSSVISYFLLFPVLYQRKKRFRKLLSSYFIPVPKPWQSTAYFLSFFLLYIIPDDFRRWEMQEFALSAHLFLSFLFPWNQQTALIPVDRQKQAMGIRKARVGIPSGAGFRSKNRLPKRKGDKKKNRSRKI